MARTEIAAEASLDTTKFQRGLAKADKGVKKFAKSAKQSFSSLIGAAALAGGTKRLGDYVTQMENSARLAGEASEEFQKFAFATKTVGIEQEKAADILKDVKDKVGDFLATGAGPMADFFENIAPLVGVTADQFKRLSGKEALQLYVSSLEKAGVSSNEMTFYLEAIASDASALLPLLQNNAAALDNLANKAERVGAVIDKDAAKAIKNMNDSMEQTGNVALSLGAKLFAFGQKQAETFFAVGTALVDSNVKLSEWYELTEDTADATDKLNRAQKTQIQLQREVNALVAKAIGQDNERLPTIDQLLAMEEEQIEFNRKKIQQEKELAEREAEKKKREEERAAELKEEMARKKQDQAIAEQELKLLKLRAIGEDELADKLEKKIEIAREALRISRAHNISLKDALALAQNIDRRSGGAGGGGEGQTLNQAMADARKQGIRFQRMRGPQGREYFQRFENGRKAGRMTKEQLEKAAARRPQQKDPSQLMEQGNKYLESIDREIRRNP